MIYFHNYVPLIKLSTSQLNLFLFSERIRKSQLFNVGNGNPGFLELNKVIINKMSNVTGRFPQN